MPSVSDRPQPRRCRLCQTAIPDLQNRVTDFVSGEVFPIHFCPECQLGLTDPVPEQLGSYYPADYYSPLKAFIYQLLQFRRPKIIKKYQKTGRILDIGCGNGGLSRLLPGYSYTGIETPFFPSPNPQVKLVGVEGMKGEPRSFDLVTFWQSLEHLRDPQLALKKAYQALKEDGTLIIECPNFSSREKLLFGSRWFHLDPPRHLFHFTPAGLVKLLKQNGFQIIVQRQIYAPEYVPIGLAQSILFLLSPRLAVVAQGGIKSPAGLLVGLGLISLLLLTLPLSLIFYWLRASPTLLTVAKKAKKECR